MERAPDSVIKAWKGDKLLTSQGRYAGPHSQGLLFVRVLPLYVIGDWPRPERCPSLSTLLQSTNVTACFTPLPTLGVLGTISYTSGAFLQARNVVTEITVHSFM